MEPYQLVIIWMMKIGHIVDWYCCKIELIIIVNTVVTRCSINNRKESHTRERFMRVNNIKTNCVEGSLETSMKPV